jgi:hypothetical protein
MPDMTAVIEAIIAAIVAGKRPLISPAGKMEIALLVFALLCAGAGVLFLALALYQYLASLFPLPAVAALVSAASVFVIAALALLLRKFVSIEKAPNHKTVHDEVSENIHAMMASLRSELEEPIRENPKTSMAVAALAGILAARRI